MASGLVSTRVVLAVASGLGGDLGMESVVVELAMVPGMAVRR